MEDLKHATVITTHKYYEKLASKEEEVEQRIKTSSDAYLSDVLNALKLVKDKKTSKLVITITTDESLNPKFIAKRYTVLKETYPRK